MAITCVLLCACADLRLLTVHYVNGVSPLVATGRACERRACLSSWLRGGAYTEANNALYSLKINKTKQVLILKDPNGYLNSYGNLLI